MDLMKAVEFFFFFLSESGGVNTETALTVTVCLRPFNKYFSGSAFDVRLQFEFGNQ